MIAKFPLQVERNIRVTIYRLSFIRRPCLAFSNKKQRTSIIYRTMSTVAHSSFNLSSQDVTENISVNRPEMVSSSSAFISGDAVQTRMQSNMAFPMDPLAIEIRARRCPSFI